MDLRRLSAACGLVLGLAGCQSLDQHLFPSEAERIDFAPLQATPGYDVLQARIDLIRRFYTDYEMRTDRRGYTYMQPVRRMQPYHHLGVDLGNGLFLDANGNLALDLSRLFQLRDWKNYRIVATEEGFFGGSTIYTKSDRVLTAESSTLIGGDRRATISAESIRIEGGILSGERDIYFNEDGSMEYDPHGLFGDWGVVQLQPTSTGARFSGDELTHVTRDSENRVLGMGIEVRRTPGRLTLLHDGVTYAMFKSESTLVFHDDDYSGFILRILPGGVATLESSSGTEYRYRVWRAR